MQTNFSSALLENPKIATSEKILRTCVHCGFCTATCPTFVTLAEENDSPRGRIYLIKEMLEHGRQADAETVKHIDRCLSCLSCMTTCPSGVHYMHLVDHARAHIEETYRRPFLDRSLRAILAFVLPRPTLFRFALFAARPMRLVAGFFPGRLGAMFALAPFNLPSPSPVDRPQVFAPLGQKKLRVGLLNGCAQRVLDPKINEATVRLLTRLGVEVTVVEGVGCCGALTHHMGKEDSALAFAKANIKAFMREKHKHGLDRIVINTSGCGTTVKDYGFMFRDDLELADEAATVAAMARDVTELVEEVGFTPAREMPPLRVAYHSACSMQHGQKITRLPFDLLKQAGFATLSIPESHLCCGSAGTYNLLQPELATRLKTRKIENIKTTQPDVIAAGNIGCMVQIGSGIDVPVVHTVELLDWATGGPVPEALASLPIAFQTKAQEPESPV
ncbi:glycolate oxidase subunit GlcF [Beijerinckia indica]|uniref:Glycolate oxidase iron-sulfur subunit n=1 Tax=Beijerinckia indica subsp. indica (strain ATCC 9039 / DSM 1715 / NCIMB 8712) TaxID=395963 RepID=B2IEC7_BEII9|nr:glycolate oxidase subunit GlcF [Beijerinckia indica]ACB95525.1 protein of unknown function DUF224 cysteine-rich region domain protein [Beijerinckia indica subsp. indica ATCC 9039]